MRRLIGGTRTLKLFALTACACALAGLPCGVTAAAPTPSVQAQDGPAAGFVQPSPTLAALRRRGALLAGVRTDDAPMAYTDARGVIAGFEPELAADIARRLGVKLQLVPVTESNRLQKLEEGAVDIVIAGVTDSPERRRVATLVEPDYFAAGVNVMVRPGTHLGDWALLRGQPVCTTQGSAYNRPMAQRYLLSLAMYATARDARLALRDGRCIAMLAHDGAIRVELARPEWEGYRIPLEPALVTPWAIALARGEAGTDFERFVGDTVAQWHRTGWLAERAQAAGLASPEFVQQAHAAWSAQDPDGRLTCARDAHGDWPARCRNRDAFTVLDATGLHLFGLIVRDMSGWDLTWLYDPYDREHILAGIGWTLLLMLGSMAGSLALGVAGALLAHSRLRAFGRIATAAAAWARTTPPLLQMYLLFFGIGALVWRFWGTTLPAYAVATWCLSWYAGASVMSSLLEAAQVRAEGTPGFRLRWRTLPQAWEAAAGSITASLVNITKATMMASAIAVPELLSSATAVLTHSGNVAEVMNLLLFLFLVLVGASVRLLGALQKLLWHARSANWRRAVLRGGRT